MCQVIQTVTDDKQKRDHSRKWKDYRQSQRGGGGQIRKQRSLTYREHRKNITACETQLQRLHFLRFQCFQFFGKRDKHSYKMSHLSRMLTAVVDVLSINQSYFCVVRTAHDSFLPVMLIRRPEAKRRN